MHHVGIAATGGKYNAHQKKGRKEPDMVPLKSIFNFPVTDNPNMDPVLRDNLNTPVTLKDLDGVVISTLTPPASGWTAETINQIEVASEVNRNGYDAFFDDHWFGSSEI